MAKYGTNIGLDREEVVPGIVVRIRVGGVMTNTKLAEKPARISLSLLK